MDINFRGVVFEVYQDGDGTEVEIFLTDKDGRFHCDEFTLNIFTETRHAITLYDVLWDRYWEENHEEYLLARERERCSVGV